MQTQDGAASSIRTRKDSTSSRLRSSFTLKRRSNNKAGAGNGGEEYDAAERTSSSTEDRRPSITIATAPDGSLQGPDIKKLASAPSPNVKDVQTHNSLHRRTGSAMSRTQHSRNTSAVSAAAGTDQSHAQASAPPVPFKPRRPPPHVENPLRREESRISWFFFGSSLVVIITTRYLHWSVAVLLATTLGYVLRTQLHIAADDSEWTRAEDARNARQDADERGSESVEWMNAVLKTVWPLINQDYFAPFIDLMEDALMLQVPGIVHSCRVEDLDQGTVPLRVQSFTLLDSDERSFIEGVDPSKVHDASVENTDEVLEGAGADGNTHFDIGEFVNLEITFAYRSPTARRKLYKSNKAEGVMDDEEREQSAALSVSHNSTLPVDQIHMLIYMSIGLQKIAAVEVPVWCEVLGIEGKMRLRLQMVPTAPFVAHVAFTLVGQPKLEISAKPLGRRMVIDAMHLPIISSYVLHSVEAVVKNFISPKSYTVDVGSLLEAQDGPRNVYAVGVIVLVVHQGIELPAADANGLSDPFVSVSFARAGKPLFTTRVLLRTRDPIWQEMAVLLVSPDEVRDQERLRLTVFDADRFSVDDPLGKVEISIDKLIHRALQKKNEPGAPSLLETQTEKLQPMRRNGKVQGRMRFSVGFFPLSKPSQGGRTATKVNLLRQAAGRHQEGGEFTNDSSIKTLPELPDSPTSPDVEQETKLFPKYATGFDKFIHSIGFPLDDEVLQHRKERSDRVKKLTTMMEGEAQATFGSPDPVWRSGILAFHIHSIEGLGFEPPQKSLSNSKRLSTKPQYTADEDVLGESTAKMPNSYVQVLLNDEAIFRSRTKTFNPQPFINAGSERWVPSFDTARIDFVVRDARQRENDPILGVVGMKLSEIITETCRVTQWYTLTGGLGFGKIRISLLWRSSEVTIPPPLRGWNVGVMEVASCYVSGISASHKVFSERKEAHMLFETVGGRAVTENVEPHDETDGGEATLGFKWPATTPIRIAVRQRYPNFLYIHLRSDSRMPGRTYKHAHAVIPLNTMHDNKETRRRVPLYETEDWQRFEQDVLRELIAPDQLVAKSADKRQRLPILQEMARDAPSGEQDRLGKRTSVANSASGDEESPSLAIVGYLDIVFMYHSGLAPEHRARMAGDHELRVAYECYQTLVDCGQRARPKMLSAARKRKLSMLAQRSAQMGDAAGADMEMIDVPDEADASARPLPASPKVDTSMGAGAQALRDGKERHVDDTVDDGVDSDVQSAMYDEYDVEYDDDELDGEEGDEDLVEADTPEGRRARVRTLHRQQRGAAQVKSYRTLQWLKTNAEDGVGRIKRVANRQQSKRVSKMESEGVSHF